MLTKKKSTNYLVPLVFITTLLRIYSFVPCERLFFSFDEFKLLDTYRFFTAIGVAVILSLLTAILTANIMKKNSKVYLLVAILIADPLFFIAQENITTVLLSSLFLLCVVALLHTQKLITHIVLFSVYVLIAATLIPETLFSTIPLLFALIIIKNFGDFGAGKVKTIIFIALPAICVTLSLLINDSHKKDLFLTNKFINGKTAYTYNEPFILIIFSLFVLIFSVIILRKLLYVAKKQSKKNKNELITEDSVALIYITGVFIFVFFGLQIFALFNDINNPAFMTMNIGAPLLLLFLLLKHGNAFDPVFEEINTHLHNRFNVYFPILVFFGLVYLKILIGYCTSPNIIYYATLYLT